MSREVEKGLPAAVFRLISKRATVREVRPLGEAFRLITLESEALRSAAWQPGAKLQLHVGGWAQRTYTPLSWDAAAGSLQLLAFLGAEGPGTRRMRELRSGDACTVLGPRRSIDLSLLPRPLAIFGDETSLGLSHALRYTTLGTADASIVLEVSSRATLEPVLAALDLGNVTLFERLPNDAHLDQLSSLLADRIASRSVQGLVLSGKASSIQRVNRVARTAGLTSRQIQTKAYWALGKAGLD